MNHDLANELVKRLKSIEEKLDLLLADKPQPNLVETHWNNIWAKYRAIDRDGEIYEYEEEPDLDAGNRQWSVSSGKSMSVGHMNELNWVNTLEVRK